MGASIKIEISAGTSIDKASGDAQRIANLLGIGCEFEFNGVTCLAVVGGSAQVLSEWQQSEQSRKALGPHDFRFANSNQSNFERRSAAQDQSK